MKYIILSLIILVLGVAKILNPVRDATQIISSPIQLGLRELAIDFKSGFTFFTNLKQIRTDNLALLEEIERLNSKLVELKQAERDNLLLKEQLRLKNENIFDKELVLADVLGNLSDQTGGTVVLNKGTKHNVKVGDNVIKGNHLVGIIKEVSYGRSVVNLITSPEISITVFDVDVIGRTEGLAIGQYGTSIQMTRVLPNEELNVGDTIVTSGTGGLFEPGLIVGKVSEITKDSAQPLKVAFLDTIVDLAALYKVFVIVER